MPRRETELEFVNVIITVVAMILTTKARNKKRAAKQAAGQFI